MQYLDGQDVSTEIKGVSAARLFKLPRFNLAFLTNPLIGIRKACLFMNSAVIKAPPYPKPIVAWIVVSMLLVAAIVSFIDRQVIAIVIDDMKSDLAVGDAQIGWLYGIFAVFYALAGFPIAWLSDHKSRKHIIAIGIFFWSLMTITCGLTQNYWQLFLARMGVGVGEATLMPAQISLIGDYFPREKIPLVISVLQAGPIIGTGAAFIIGGYVLEIVAGAGAVVVPFFGELQPWQLTFIYVGLPGLALALLFLLIRVFCALRWWDTPSFFGLFHFSSASMVMRTTQHLKFSAGCFLSPDPPAQLLSLCLLAGLQDEAGGMPTF